MTSAFEPRAVVPALPGLDHLCGQVKHWEAAVRTLSFTASAIAASIGAGGAAKQGSLDPSKPMESVPHGLEPAPSLGPGPQAHLLPAAPTLVVAAPQLKPGRVFVVANLQGAYYTLLELLSRHKFDFRSDNLLHLGNLVAPPAPLLPQQPAAAATAFSGPLPLPLPPQSQLGGSSRRMRNSAAVLKLVRRHGNLGPMGGNECLTLLAAARSNRLRAEQRAEEERRLAGLLAQQRAGRAPVAVRGRCGGLSMQLAGEAAAAATAAAAAPQGPAESRTAVTAVATAAIPLQRCVSRTPAAWLGSDSSGSSSDDSDSEDGSGGEEDVEMVVAPLTPLRDEPAPAAFPSPPPLPGSTALSAPTSDSTKAKVEAYSPPPAAVSRTVGVSGGGGGLCLEDNELSQLLSLPACVVLEAYGVRLVHASPSEHDQVAGDAGAPVPYHTLFSHRRPGGALVTTSPGVGCATAALGTGLSSCRDVVRFAVLPPLRTLQRKSPGFRAKVAAASAPSREELLLEVFEEPLSELDV